MTSIDDAMMNDKDLWQEPKKDQTYGISYWIVPDGNVPDYSPGERVVVEIKAEVEPK